MLKLKTKIIIPKRRAGERKLRLFLTNAARGVLGKATRDSTPKDVEVSFIYKGFPARNRRIFFVVEAEDNEDNACCLLRDAFHVRKKLEEAIVEEFPHIPAEMPLLKIRLVTERTT